MKYFFIIKPSAFLMLLLSVWPSGEIPCAEPVEIDPTPIVSPSRGPWKTRATVQWSGTPLRESLVRLSESYSFRFLLDRRVDPSTKLIFEAKNEPLEQVLTRLASKYGLGCRLLSGTVYIGTEDSADMLTGLLADRRRKLAGLAPDVRKVFRENVSIKSPFLGTPKEILETVARRYRFSWSNLDSLPHDLWNETELLGTVDEILTLLLLGFDRTFAVDETGKMFTVIPLPEIEITRRSPDKEAVGTPSSLSDETRPAPKIPLARRRFTIKVEEQQLDALLRSLAVRLELELKLDEKSLKKKNVALDRRVSFEVKNATGTELFRAVLQPLNVQFRFRGDTIEVF